ncbi:unnamed protein product [Calypogeia fissa]
MGKMSAGGLSPSVVNDFKHACAISLSLAFFLLVMFIDWDPIFHGRSLPTSTTPASFEGPFSGDESERLQLDLTVSNLIEDIQAATREASGGVSTDLTAAEREEWIRQNPCRSRSELLPMYDRRKHVQELSPNPILDLVLAEYSKLHRACMLKVGPNVTDFFIKNKSVPGCKFTIGSPMYGTGLGNKIIVTISAILYSVLTQRVILVPTRTNLPSFMCEPFVGSSWTLDSSTFIFPDGPRGQLPWEDPVPFPPEWTEDLGFLGEVDGWIAKENVTDVETLQPPALNHAMSVTVRWQPNNRFYCRTEQKMVDQVPWLYWGGCIYSVPKIFGSPVFGRYLEALFPDRMVMTRVLRSVLLPGDVVFGKLKELDNKYFSQADRRVGIQLRSRQGKDHYEKMNAILNKRILDCVLDNEILPNASSTWDIEESHPPSSSTKVFIASLYRGLLDYLKGVYQDVHTVNGEEVEVIQVTSNEEQRLSKEEDIQAFVEILALSLSDQLLVTPSSTFGSIAQGYGALVPWFIETREDTPQATYKSCERAQSIDICHQYTEFVYKCPHDPSMNEKPIFDSEPSLKRCLNIDHESGVQLISTFQSDLKNVHENRMDLAPRKLNASARKPSSSLN